VRLLIAAVGKLKRGAEQELCAQYLTRAETLGRSLGLSPIAALELTESKAAEAGARKAAEAEALFSKIPETYLPVCLDPRGKARSSEAFAALLAQRRDEGAPGMAFLIGGPDGLGAEVVEKAADVLSLSPMTLPHGLARIVLAEQLYRAVTILAGHPYHRA
jgi:23S rRNA (pseudouridine1915-N3)-methyltransferase